MTDRPANGARVVFERVATSERGARYRVTVHAPAADHVVDAEIEGAVTKLGAWSSAPPSWAATFVERFLKGMPKKHADDGSWPRKLTRWREPG